jgi:hypothetical protein
MNMNSMNALVMDDTVYGERRAADDIQKSMWL